MRKKVAGIGLVYILITALLTACFGDSNADEVQTERNGKPKLTVAGEADKTMPEGKGTLEENQWIDWIRANGPADISVIPIPGDNDLERYSAMLATGSAPDIIYSGSGDTMNALINQKQLMPLDDIVEKYSTVYKERMEQYPLLKEMGSRDGKLYLLGAPAPELYPEQVRFIRLDWLKKLNLEVPTTTEEFLEVARAFANNDPDGNGIKDTYGTNLSGKGALMFNWTFGDVKWVIENGEMTLNLDRSRDAAVFQKTLFDEGLVDKDYLTDAGGAKAEQDWVNGKLGIYNTNRAVTPAAYRVFETFMKNNPDAEIAVLPNLEGPHGTFSMDTYNPVDFEVAFNANLKDPETAMEFIDFMITDSTQKVMTQGLEGVHHKADGNKCSEPINPETLQNEMAGSIVFLETIDCDNKIKYYLDPNDPQEKTYLGMINDMEHLVRPDQPLPIFTPGIFTPIMPNDINMIQSNAMKTIDDLWIKFIIGGESQDSEQVLAAVKDTWVRSGGEKVEAWYKQWYQENKNNWIFTDEIYDMIGLPY